jgi:hypothetical protein
MIWRLLKQEWGMGTRDWEKVFQIPSTQYPIVVVTAMSRNSKPREL